jgi:hypothetical protein
MEWMNENIDDTNTILPECAMGRPFILRTNTLKGKEKAGFIVDTVRPVKKSV